HARRGQVYASLETRLELAWVAAACLAVALRGDTWIGVLLLAAFLVVVVVVHVRRHAGLSVCRPVAAVPLGERLRLRAETLAGLGCLDEAVRSARLAAGTPGSPAAAATRSEADVRREIGRVRRASDRRSASQQPVADDDVVEVVDGVVDEVAPERLD